MIRTTQTTDKRVRSPGLRPLSLAIGIVLLAGCPTVDLGDQPPVPGDCQPDPAEFEATIWPMALSTGDDATTCVKANCHSQATGRSGLRLIENPSGAADHAANYESVIRFLNCAAPRSSRLLTKPVAGIDGHGGGDLWTYDTAPASTVEEWIGSAP
jgi:hypothetical protein